MSDKTKRPGGGKGRPPMQRGPRGGDGESRPPRRAAGGDSRPFRRKDDEARPRRERAEGESRPPRRERPAEDRPARSFAKREGGEGRPFRSREERSGDERPARTRAFEKRDGGNDRPFRRRDDEAPRGPRREERSGGDRPARSRPFAKRDEGGERPFRGRKEDRQRSYAREAAPQPAGGPRERKNQKSSESKEFSERIAKVIARAGLCSRRDAEAWIEAGRVSVNGEVLTSPALDVTKSDKIVVDGAPLPTRERTRLFLYHKPRGLVTTARDPEGRETVFSALPPGLPRVVTIGRLDINTEGLLLLTNDGGLSRVIELPETGWLRRYRVRAYGEVTQPQLDALREGVTIDGMHYGPIEADLDREQGDNVWLVIGLREGKNREVKRILEHLGLQVNRLIRVSFGPFQLGDLPEGAVEEVRTRVLADQLGHDLAEAAQVDFEAPVFVYDEDDFRPRDKTARADAPRGRETRGREGFGRDRDEPRRGRDERPSRFKREDAPEGRRGRREEPEAEEAPRPKRRHPTEVKRSVWRAGEEEAEAPRAKAPRRGTDPRAARQESAERTHERAGKVQDRRGRAVLVERIKADPAARVREEPEPRKERAERSARPYRERDDRAAEPRERERPSRWGEQAQEAPRRRSFAKRSEERPPRSFKDGERAPRGDRPVRPRSESRTEGGERPKRSFGDKPRGEGFRERRPEGGERSGKPGFRKQRTEGDRPATGRNAEKRSGGFKPRQEGDRPRGDRPGGFKPRSGGDRPGGGRTGGGGRPGGGSRPGKGPRRD
jgi:23S rRNA pseudouridine2605 synthase